MAEFRKITAESKRKQAIAERDVDINAIDRLIEQYKQKNKKTQMLQYNYLLRLKRRTT